ncbi:MAG: dihydrofolate reductase family protein [Microcella sp.]
MLLRRVLPSDHGVVDLGSADGDALLREWYRPVGPGLRLMMIATLDGHAVGDDGTSVTLSSDTDRRVLHAVRAHADAIVIGAKTVRREPIGSAGGAAVVVVSASGALEGHRLTAAAAETALIVVTTPTGADSARAALAPLPAEVIALTPDESGRPSAPAIVEALRARGFEHLVCEGGPALAAQLRASGLVDEVCLTTAPALGGAVPLSGDDTPVTRLRPRQLLVDEEGFSYGRWVPEGDPATS